MTSFRIGIDLGGTKIEAVCLGGTGKQLDRIRVPTPQGDYQSTLTVIKSLVKELETSVGQACAVGIGTPGTLQPSTGLMKNCNSTWLNGQPLKADLELELGRTIRMANDADCFTLAEACAGAGESVASVFGVILGTGVGGGIVINGQLLQGPNGLVGEWGHTPLPYFRVDNQLPGPLRLLEDKLSIRPCYCGRTNCVETFLSGIGLSTTHEQLWGEQKTAEQIANAAAVQRMKKEQVAEASQSLALYEVMLARSLAQVINIVDPELIVLGGGLSKIHGLTTALMSQLQYYVFSGDCATPIVVGAGGDAAGVVGAAQLQ